MPKGALHSIADEKRERVLREAALMFAERGFAATDMAALAQRCGIAKGSLYNYFDSKDELYLYVCRLGIERSRAAVWGGVASDWDIHGVIDHIFREGVAFTRRHPEFVKLYLSIASSGLEQFASALSHEVEKPTADRLRALLADGVRAGTVTADVGVAELAWLINNTYVMTLAALVSEHFRVRLRAYLDIPARMSERDIDAMCARVIAMLHRSLQPSPQPKRTRTARNTRRRT